MFPESRPLTPASSSCTRLAFVGEFDILPESLLAESLFGLEELCYPYEKRLSKIRTASSRARPRVREVSRPPQLRRICRHGSRCGDARQTLSADDRIRSSRRIRRDFRHDCLPCRQRRRAYSGKGGFPRLARDRRCITIAFARGIVFPRTKLSANQPGHNRTARTADSLLREIRLSFNREDSGLLWHVLGRIRQNHLRPVQ